MIAHSGFRFGSAIERRLLIVLVLALTPPSLRGAASDLGPDAALGCGTVPFQDQFSAALDPCWTFTDPVGNSSQSVAAQPGHLQMIVPQGSAHDCWNTTPNCARMLRSVPNSDAVYETKIDGVNLVSRNQDYGIMLYQDATNYLRFEFWTAGSGVYVRAFKVIGGVGTYPPTITTASTIALGASNYLRVTKSGATYTLAYGTSGTTWTTVGSLSQPGFAVLQAGVFVNNALQNPQTTANFDYFSASAGSAPTDTTPPLRSNGQPNGSLPSGTMQTVLSLATDENASCRYGTAPGTAFDAMTPMTASGGTTAHSTTVSGLADGGSYSYDVRCRDGGGNTNTDDFQIAFSVSSQPSGGPYPFLDPFSGALATGWTFADPVGNSSQSVAAQPGHLQMIVPQGSAHDCWNTSPNCARMLRSFPNSDAVYETKIDGLNIASSNQDYGIMLYQNATNYIRFEFWTAGSGVYVRAYKVIAGAGVIPASITTAGPIALGASNYLRVTKSGATYTLAYGTSGTTWTTAGSLNQPGFAVSQAGVFVNNAAQNPQTTANFDYFSASAGSAPTDTTPPLRSNGQPSGSLPSGTIQTVLSLATDENASCRYGTAPGTAFDAMTPMTTSGGTTAHSTTVSGLADGGSYSYDVRCRDGGGNTNTDDFQIAFSVSSQPSGGAYPFLDPFSGSLATGWTFADPVGNASQSVAAQPGHLQMIVPQGSAHDCWNTTPNCARMLRSFPNSDAVYETKIDGVNLASRNQDYGIMLYQNATNYIRFEFWTAGSGVYVRAFKIIGGAGTYPPTITTASPVAVGPSNFLRVTKIAADFRLEYSTNGEDWILAGSMSQPGFVVSQAGVFVNNAFQNPQTTANFDYFSATDASASLPRVLLPGYTLTRISDAVPAGAAVQMAFDPADPAHLYTSQISGTVTRYDYDQASGALSNARVVASGLVSVLGLAFHDGDLFATLDLGGSISERPGDGRITRLSNRDANGVFLARHDFVHSINKGNHHVNQLAIAGDTLYVGIGAVGRKGNPAEENVYTMTIARIVDLAQVDWSGPIGPDFKGPINHLADPGEWVNTAGADGRLRYFASGFRNPFGIAIDADGDLWVSTNGNSDPGFLSFDYLYKKVPLGGQADFPPASFGFPPPHITGTPIDALTNLGQNPSPTGLDFMPGGPDTGKVVLALAGASDQINFPVGRNVLLVDPDTGAFQILVDRLDLPTDVVKDPFGRLLISDLMGNAIYLLTPPPAP